jgi:hypothetical protein
MFIGLGLFVLVSGCSKTPRTNPCKLLSINEVQALDDTVARTEWYPPGKRDMNELCTYNDGNNERRIMLFFWKDKSLDPLDKIKSAMQGGDTRVVEIEGVGETAAAGFEGDVLKLFAAKSSRGMVGIRVREPVKDGSDRFNTLKNLAGKALSRLK